MRHSESPLRTTWTPGRPRPPRPSTRAAANITFAGRFTTADGTHRSFRTAGDTPKVELKDPLQPHKDLLKVYKDSDIHNVTAYLVTLK